MPEQLINFELKDIRYAVFDGNTDRPMPVASARYLQDEMEICIDWTGGSGTISCVEFINANGDRIIDQREFSNSKSLMDGDQLNIRIPLIYNFVPPATEEDENYWNMGDMISKEMGDRYGGRNTKKKAPQETTPKVRTRKIDLL